MTEIGLRVALLGMSERAASALELLLDNDRATDVQLSDENSADLTIIDLDGLDSQELLHRHRQTHTTRKVIGLSLHNRSYDGVDVLLEKPVRGTQLTQAVRAAMRDALAEEGESPAGEVPREPDPASAPAEELPRTQETDAGLATPAEVVEDEDRPVSREPQPASRSTHRAATSIQRRVLHTATREDGAAISSVPSTPGDPTALSLLHRAVDVAAERNCDVSVRHAMGQILVLAQGREAVVDFTDRGLWSTIRAKGGEHQWSVKTSRRRPTRRGSDPVMVDELLWKVGVWTYGSTLPEGFDMDTPVRLRRWPNITRTFPVEDASRIAALLAKRPLPLNEVGLTLGLDSRHLRAFCSAATAARLLAPAISEDTSGSGRAESGTRGDGAEPAPKRRRLFRSILDRLRDDPPEGSGR